MENEYPLVELETSATARRYYWYKYGFYQIVDKSIFDLWITSRVQILTRNVFWPLGILVLAGYNGLRIANERRLGKTKEWMKEKVLNKIALCFHCSSGSILSNIWHNFANCCKSMTGEVRGCFLLRNQRPNPTLTSSSFRFAMFSCVNL